MKKMVRIISLGLAVCLLALSICSCDPPGGAADTRSDEEKIRDRVDTFVTALNAGDADAAIGCLDAKNRNLLNATLNIGGGLLGSLIGVEVDARDVLALAIGLSSDAQISAEIKEIKITSDTTATVSLTATAKIGGETGTENLTLDMVKEMGNWYFYFEVDWTSLMNSLGSLG